jgi:signal transduction histidine kinase
MSEPVVLGAVGQQLVASRQEITEEWRRGVAAIPELSRLPASAIVDHMPEFLYELAWASAGDEEGTRRAYQRLVSGHALQRLGFGVALSTLIEEYAVLRRVLLTHLLRLEPAAGSREEILEIEGTLDVAIGESVRTFASQREEQRERFISILGHDLRSPLQAVSLGAENILRQPECGAPIHARAAAAIRRSAERMQRLISDLIDFARGQFCGGIPAVPVTCDMGEVCREVADELRAAHPDRELSVVTEGDLAGSWDRDRLVQALGNLASNAVAHGRDPIAIRALEAPDRESVTTEVHNFGPAIPAEQIPNLFDAFHRPPAARPDGLGLGLFIVQQIAHAHGAECVVRSSECEGTTFSIRWPRTPLTEVPRPYQPRA